MRKRTKRYGVTISADEKSLLKEVQSHFNVTENEWTNLFIDLGNEFIDTRMQWNPMGKQQLKKDRLFWAWWEMKWARTDLGIVDDLPQLKRRASVYENLHRKCFRTPLPNHFWRELNRKATATRTKKQTAKIEKR